MHRPQRVLCCLPTLLGVDSAAPRQLLGLVARLGVPPNEGVDALDRRRGLLHDGRFLGRAVRELLRRRSHLRRRGGDRLRGSTQLRDRRGQRADHRREGAAECVGGGAWFDTVRQVAGRYAVGDMSHRLQVLRHVPECHAECVLLRAWLHANGHVTGGNRLGGGRHLLQVLDHLLHGAQKAPDLAVDAGRNGDRYVAARQTIGDMCRFAKWVGKGSRQQIFGEQRKEPQERHRA